MCTYCLILIIIGLLTYQLVNGLFIESRELLLNVFAYSAQFENMAVIDRFNVENVLNCKIDYLNINNDRTYDMHYVSLCIYTQIIILSLYIDIRMFK